MMLVHRPFDKAQTKSCSIRAIGPRWIGSIETFKKIRKWLRNNANPIICGFKKRIVPIPGNRDPNMPARAREFNGVVDKVQDDAFDPTTIAAQHHAGIAMPRKSHIL